MPLQSPPGLSGRSCAPPIRPPPPPDCSAARSSPVSLSSPRRHQWAPAPASSSTSRRRALRSENSAAPAPAPSPSPSPSPTTPVRRRRQNTSCPHAATTNTTNTTSNTVHPPVRWGEDTITDHASSLRNTTSQVGPGDQDDDDFLSAFADHNFSSPSSYPPFTASRSAGGASPRHQAAPLLHQATDTAAASPRRTAACSRALPASWRPTTQLSSSTVEESQPSISSHEDWDRPLSQMSNGSAPDMMPPPPLRFRHLHVPRGTSPSPLNKRQPPLESDASPGLSLGNVMMDPPQGLLAPEDDLFGDEFFLQGVDLIHDKDLTTIDLTEATDVPEDLKKTPPMESKGDNKIKISKFQCVICMDDASTLTVTHCGHLYCAQCLHSSLHVEATKNKCPMCRAKIDVKSRASYSTKTKGFWPLELKLMTETRKGKRKADNIS
ncbi:hypothetical protein E4U53_004106 [Claviceps sorghi]|nr:hypothetical protein E4U53_004106 [Claviceps sorghi]